MSLRATSHELTRKKLHYYMYMYMLLSHELVDCMKKNGRATVKRKNGMVYKTGQNGQIVCGIGNLFLVTTVPSPGKLQSMGSNPIHTIHLGSLADSSRYRVEVGVKSLSPVWVLVLDQHSQHCPTPAPRE